MTGLGKKLKVCSVSVIYKQKHTETVTRLGYFVNIQGVSEIVGRGNIYCRRQLVCPVEILSYLFRTNLRIKVRATPRRKPPYLEIQECRRTDEHLMGISRCKYPAFFAHLRSILRHKIEHSSYGKRGALGRVEGISTEKL